MNCPICQKECVESAEIVPLSAMVLVGGIATRTDGGQTVQRCPEHGVMKMANCFTDGYMKAAHPELQLVNGCYQPKSQRKAV